MARNTLSRVAIVGLSIAEYGYNYAQVTTRTQIQYDRSQVRFNKIVAVSPAKVADRVADEWSTSDVLSTRNEVETSLLTKWRNSTQYTECIMGYSAIASGTSGTTPDNF